MPQARTKATEQIQRRNRVASLYLRGHTQAEIAEQVGVDRSTVSRDLEWVRGEWLDSAIRDFDEHRAKELARIDETERQAWIGWERSLKDREVQTRERGTGTQGPIDKRKRTREGQSGNPAFLATVLACVEKRCKLLGLEAAPAPPPSASSAAESVAAMDGTIPPPGESA